MQRNLRLINKQSINPHTIPDKRKVSASWDMQSERNHRILGIIIAGSQHPYLNAGFVRTYKNRFANGIISRCNLPEFSNCYSTQVDFFLVDFFLAAFFFADFFLAFFLVAFFLPDFFFTPFLAAFASIHSSA